MSVLLRLNSSIDDGTVGHGMIASGWCRWNSIRGAVSRRLALHHVSNRSLSGTCFVSIGDSAIISGWVNRTGGCFGRVICGFLLLVLLVGHGLWYSVGQKLEIVEFRYSGRCVGIVRPCSCSLEAKRNIGLTNVPVGDGSSGLGF